jgi:hypothetical protein
MATGAGAVIAAAVARARREIREHFEEAEAFDPGRAVAYEAPDRIHRRQFDLLVGRGILRQTGDGRYWMDREALRLEQERRDAAAVVMFKIIVIGVALAIVIGLVAARL